MLVLARGIGEKIVINDSKTGEEIEVVVLGILGGVVRIGINAPKSYAINRKEIHDKKKGRGEL